MYYIYILYSTSSNLYYIGYSNHPKRRLIEHNSSSFNTFTSKHRPWEIKAIFECSTNEAEAMHIEKFIKKQKSRKLLEQLCNPDFVPINHLARLVRVPYIRD
ncbi:MAG: GIY-YIG nuclease family protein [Chitinophagaceae bacterium]|nr:GIY-YIG nuclease family protein [Chitinophagaceae bacterium]MCW5904034.1 GIY-YIG nuclease family protein [Chitinophagaceae bacterium]